VIDEVRRRGHVFYEQFVSEAYNQPRPRARQWKVKLEEYGAAENKDC